VGTVGIYTRLSEDRTGEQTSTGRQEADCRKLADMRGWDVARIYEDVDLSGYSGVARPGFEEMLADLKAGTISGVVTWKLDRLARNRSDMHRLVTVIEEQGAIFASVNDPVDTSNEMGWVIVDLLASMARAESANTSTRVRRANEDRALKGLPHPSGQRAFGYTRGWKIERAEARLLRAAARRLLAGDSLNAIVTEWNAKGITTTSGSRWRAWTLSRTLRSPHVAGLRKHHGEVYPGTWTPILDREQWERLRAILDRRGAGHQGGGRLKHLLSGGLLRCGECGSRMSSRPREDGRLRYICRADTGGCGHVGILGDELEVHVADVVLAAIDPAALSKARRELVDVREGEDLAGELAALEERLETLANDYYTEGLVDRKTFVAQRGQLLDRVEKIKAKMDATPEAAMLAQVGPDLSAWWHRDATSTDQRRALLASVLDRVEIGPAVRGRNRFDGDRVTFVWRV
jgi:site-specific DNA recombinase